DQLLGLGGGLPLEEGFKFLLGVGVKRLVELLFAALGQDGRPVSRLGHGPRREVAEPTEGEQPAHQHRPRNTTEHGEHLMKRRGSSCGCRDVHAATIGGYVGAIIETITPAPALSRVGNGGIWGLAAPTFPALTGNAPTVMGVASLDHFP